MIARHETHLDKTDVWSALAAPLAQGTISWRQDGRPINRDGRWIARFVAYVDANTVRERLDAVVPGEWDLTLDLLPPVPAVDDEGQACSFKARLQILGVIREDVGTGRDYKAAATDAFKRAAVRFGIAHELYSMEPNWVPVDGDGRFAHPLEDPQTAYDRRIARRAERSAGRTAAVGGGSARLAAPERESERNGAAVAPAERAAAPVEPFDAPVTPAAAPAVPAAVDAELVECPKCGGRMWDNRVTKRNPKAPDFKCRDRSCDGVIWPPRATAGAPAGDGAASTGSAATQHGARGEGAATPAAGPAVDIEAPTDARSPRRGRARAAAAGAPARAAAFDAGPLGGEGSDDEIPF